MNLHHSVPVRSPRSVGWLLAVAGVLAALFLTLHSINVPTQPARLDAAPAALAAPAPSQNLFGQHLPPSATPVTAEVQARPVPQPVATPSAVK